MLNEIFSAAKDDTSLLIRGQDSRYFIFHVNDIQPTQTRPLEAVKDSVTKAWQQDERAKEATRQAETLLGQAHSVSTLEQLAAAGPGRRLVTIQPLKRSDPGSTQGLGPDAVQALFETAPGKVADKVVQVPAGAAIVATDAIIPADPKGDVATLETALGNELKSEILTSYEDALRERYTVEIHQAALDQLIQSTAQ